MPLTVGVTPFAQWTSLSTLLTRMGWDETQDITAYKAGDGPWLLLHTRPEYAVASALDAGIPPEEALTEWQFEAQELIDFFKENREQAAMTDISCALRHPQALVQWLGANHTAFQDRFSGLEQGIPELSPPPVATPLSLLIATQLVAQTPALSPLLAQLEASSVPVGNPGEQMPHVDIPSVLNELNNTADTQQSEKLSGERDDLKAENDLLLRQLFAVQEELERIYLDNKAKDARCQEYQDELAKQEADNAELKIALDRQNNENNILNSRLRATEDSKESLQSQNAELETTIQSLRQCLSEYSASKRGSPLKSVMKSVKKLSPSARNQEKCIELVRQSDLFDADWYVRKNPDVAAKFPDPAMHYTLFGGLEGRAASERFDSIKYLKRHPDVAKSGVNPLVHYLLHGKAEGRKL
ncbi:hypothetical protein [Marinimicrobium sp. LS-A18]|uniref:hypothetical protein n=1 Tax=Marinimicrobium sp. LS-A18 TaxID=1381596 RepID=UPI000464112C|nr:hypothetical protein [Marinimicrobium sp. LS-A18]